MHAVSNYLHRLSESLSAGWNRFWFTPSDVISAGVLRILSGLLAFYYVLSYSGDLVRWFGPAGLLPARIVRQPEFLGPTLLDGASLREASFHLSYLSWIHDPWLLWIVHGLGLVVVALFTVGLFSRITNVLAVVVTLAYVHRAPMITGPLEPVLTMLLIYLCFAPTGACLSLDAWLRKRKEGAASATDVPSPSWTTTISLRLIQLHLAGLVLVMGLSKLAGETWWMGDAVWWLIAHTESRLIDLTFLSGAPLVINAWTHGIVLFELVFPLLIWNRLARPLLLAGAVLVWVPLALVTGWLPFFAGLLVAATAFVPASSLRKFLDQPVKPGKARKTEPQEVAAS